MYHLRLTKGLSYRGAVCATRENPDAYTDSEATAQAAVASGYFALVDGPAPECSVAATQPPAYGGKTLDEMTVPEIETFATYRGVSLKGCRTRATKIARLIEAMGEEITTGPLDYGSPTVVELQEK